ncbi:hypothetical protein [Paenibacillus sp. Mc5Re-14]|uniref:hypothetical protein n=1 Tax=Paenibacillus sp. Mc5Re-14 TaxID=1030529 RepID=UPI000B879CFC|nr:hypothetical protein [Paenibacillus sp. Mc5Re-14]
MARRKKQELDTVPIADHYETVVAFTQNCFKDGQVMCIMPKFGETYQISGKNGNYTFTEQVLEDMLETGQVKITWRNEKEVSLMGVIV